MKANNSGIFTRIYQDPSMKILSWMAIGRGKKHTLINTPSRSSSEVNTPYIENNLLFKKTWACLMHVALHVSLNPDLLMF